MTTGILYVETRPVSAEREAEFHRWYEEVHIPEVVALEGFVSGRRYAPVTDEGPYVAIYEIDAEDPSTAFQALIEAIGAGRLQMTDAMQMDPAPTLRLLKQLSSYEPAEQGV